MPFFVWLSLHTSWETENIHRKRSWVWQIELWCFFFFIPFFSFFVLIAMPFSVVFYCVDLTFFFFSHVNDTWSLGTIFFLLFSYIFFLLLLSLIISFFVYCRITISILLRFFFGMSWLLLLLLVCDEFFIE